MGRMGRTTGSLQLIKDNIPCRFLHLCLVHVPIPQWRSLGACGLYLKKPTRLVQWDGAHQQLPWSSCYEYDLKVDQWPCMSFSRGIFPFFVVGVGCQLLRWSTEEGVQHAVGAMLPALVRNLILTPRGLTFPPFRVFNSLLYKPFFHTSLLIISSNNNSVNLLFSCYQAQHEFHLQFFWCGLFRILEPKAEVVFAVW